MNEFDQSSHIKRCPSAPPQICKKVTHRYHNRARVFRDYTGFSLPALGVPPLPSEVIFRESRDFCCLNDKTVSLYNHNTDETSILDTVFYLHLLQWPYMLMKA